MGKAKGPVVTIGVVRKIISLAEAGFVNGIGDPEPGEMCVEAAVAYAFGEPHNDRPKCVDDELCSAKISLNDGFDGTDKERGRVLRRVAIAQLGTKGIKAGAIDGAVEEIFRSIVVGNGREAEILKVKAAVAKAPFKTYDDFEDIIGDLEALRDSIENDEINLDNLNYNIGEHSDVFGDPNNDEEIALAAEIFTQALIRLKTPGSKYLYLVPLTKKEQKQFKVVLDGVKRLSSKKTK